VRCYAVRGAMPRVTSLTDIIGTTAQWDALSDRPLPAVSLDADDAATIFFTSGTSGKPKGVLASHRAMLSNITGAAFAGARASLRDRGTLSVAEPDAAQGGALMAVPFFHVTGAFAVLSPALHAGNKLVLMYRWDAGEALRLIEAERITYFVGVPLMSYEMLTHPERDRYDLSSVTDLAAGGAPRPAEHVRRIAAEMSPAPLIGYGLTETNAVGTGNWRSNYLAKPSSAGRASPPLVELAILDPSDGRVAQGGRGEVCIRSVANFLEYWGRPADTAAAFTADGFFRTGDVGFLDEDGYLHIVDRIKDMVIRGGENISCQEVEAALYAHAGVAEAAVFGLPDERLGEVPAAVVHVRDGEAASAEDLAAFLHARIAAFKVPARIWMSPTPLPRLGTEKIDKVSLRARYRALAAAG